MRIILLILLILARISIQAQGIQKEISVSIGTVERCPALLALPDDYSTTSGRYPLIVFLHGKGEASDPANLSKIYKSTTAGGPANFIARGLWPSSFTNPADGKAYKFIVVSPQAKGYSTSSSQLMYLLSDLVNTYRIDTNRIYLTGLSAGGDGVVKYTSNVTPSGSPMSTRFKPAAIVPMSAAAGMPQPAWIQQTIKDSVKVFGFGSETDLHGIHTHLYITGAYGGNNGPPPPGLGANGRFKAYTGGHCCWGTYYNPAFKESINGKLMNIYEWMLQYSRNPALPPVTNPPPVPNVSPLAKAAQAVLLPADSVLLVGTGADSDGSIVKYEWSTVSGATPAVPTHAKPGGRSFILKADAQGYLVIDNAGGTYRPGDTIYLNGYFKSVAISNMKGAADNFITVRNVPGQTTIVGDSTWSGGAWAQGLVFRNCHFIEVSGTHKNNFKIVGSNSTAKDSRGYPVRSAYMDLGIGDLSDNFIVHDLSIRHGGTGVWAKTEVSATKSSTWFPNTYLDNFEFYNLDIYNTYNEGMYVGHTATYWNIGNNSPLYPGPKDPVPDPNIYKRPIKLRNVKIHDNYLHDIGNDGIQTAAIDNLEVYNNEIFNWATKQQSADNGAMLIGGRVKGFNVHDNYVHDGWGELMQVYAEGGALSVIRNNLFVRNKMDGVSFRGTDNLSVSFVQNTVAYAGSSTIRVNGYFGGTEVRIEKCILAVPRTMYTGIMYPKFFIYTENNGYATEAPSPNEAKKYVTATEANWSEANFFLPNSGSPAVGYGYVKNSNVGISHSIVSPTSQNTMVKGLKAGTYVFRLTVTDNRGATASDEVKVLVQ